MNRDLISKAAALLLSYREFTGDFRIANMCTEVIADIDRELARPEQDADMFWSVSNPEAGPFGCIYAAVEDEFNNGDLQIGDVLRFARAVTLPNVEVEITSVYQDDFEFKFVGEVKP